MYHGGMDKYEFSRLLYGQKATPIDPAILAKLNAGEDVAVLDTEHRAVIHYEKLPDGRIDISAEHMDSLKPLAQKYIGVDPGSDAGVTVGWFPPFSADRGVIQYSANDPLLNTWASQRMGSTTGRYRHFQLAWPRGNGKTLALENLAKAQKALAKATEKASEGLKKLSEANEAIARLEYEAHCKAEEAVTDEKVAEFAERYYLPEDYARDILITAYVDSLLEEGKPNDSSESTTEDHALPDDHSVT